MTEKNDQVAKQHASGSIKEALGKITGDDAMAAEGRAYKASGNPKVAGKILDAGKAFDVSKALPVDSRSKTPTAK